MKAFLCIIALFAIVVATTAAGTFVIQGNSFVKDGQTFTIVSGSLHYFRVMPDQWQDRLSKLKQGGLNAVTLYVPWNLHEPTPKTFDFQAGLDLVAFLKLVEAEGLIALIRPGPYICAEWEFGGFPYWLLKNDSIVLRSYDPVYLEAVDRWLDILVPLLIPLQYSRGGPIAMLQIENEYGSYGDDHRYLQYLLDGYKRRGLSEVVFFASNGDADHQLQSGALDSLLRTVNLGGEPTKALANLRKWQPHGPLMITEFWDGWFDAWGQPHHTTDPQQDADWISTTLSLNASISLYMYHGGTSWRLMSGANADGNGLNYNPQVTSYDYDAPVNEAGDVTAKWSLFRDVIGKYLPVPHTPAPPPLPKTSSAIGVASPLGSVFDMLSKLPVTTAAAPLPFELLDVDYGCVLYRSHIDGPQKGVSLTLPVVHDMALVFVDSVLKGVVHRNNASSSSVSIDIAAGGATLDILVENQGRVNFGMALTDRKGLPAGVELDGVLHFGWQQFALRLQDLPALPSTHEHLPMQPCFWAASLKLSVVADTYLSLPGWTKGMAWVNGFNVGRYWNIGPQKALFVPASLLKQGANDIVVFELFTPGTGVQFVTTNQ